MHCTHCVYGHTGFDWKAKLFTFLYVVFMLMLIRNISCCFFFVFVFFCFFVVVFFLFLYAVFTA